MSHCSADDRKTYYHLEIPRQLSGLFWRLMAENFEFIVTRQQHSPDGKNLKIELKVEKAAQECQV